MQGDIRQPIKRHREVLGGGQEQVLYCNVGDSNREACQNFGGVIGCEL